ncbi:MAG: TetR family transcriptional regulator [Myxococcota bacterium]|nr:TetR family transcriptional regulator [Myxococcota bacterium]
MGSTPQSRTESADGRALRSERSREAIVQALLALIREGSVDPTAQQVADRAKVGIRTVFRHFSDMESLFASMNEKVTAEALPLMRPASREGDVESRLRDVVARRAALFEKIAPFKRAALPRRSRSAFIAKQHQTQRRELREDLLRSVPELKDAPARNLAALEVATSFEAWEHYRSDQRLSVARAQEAMETAALSLV